MINSSSPLNGQSSTDPFVGNATDQQNATAFVKGQPEGQIDESAKDQAYTFELSLPSSYANLTVNEKEVMSSLYSLILSVMDLLQEYGIAQTVLIQRKTESVSAENEKLAQIVMITKGSPGRLGDDTDEAKTERNDFMQFLSTLRENIQIKKGEIEDSIKLDQSYATTSQNVTNSVVDLLTTINTTQQALFRFINSIKAS